MWQEYIHFYLTTTHLFLFSCNISFLFLYFSHSYLQVKGLFVNIFKILITFFTIFKKLIQLKLVAIFSYIQLFKNVVFTNNKLWFEKNNLNTYMPVKNLLACRWTRSKTESKSLTFKVAFPAAMLDHTWWGNRCSKETEQMNENFLVRGGEWNLANKNY